MTSGPAVDVVLQAIDSLYESGDLTIDAHAEIRAALEAYAEAELLGSGSSVLDPELNRNHDV